MIERDSAACDHRMISTSSTMPMPPRMFVTTTFERRWNRTLGRDRFVGLTWKDMPGSGDFERKCNWFLFRRGKLIPLAQITRHAAQHRARVLQALLSAKP